MNVSPWLCVAGIGLAACAIGVSIAQGQPQDDVLPPPTFHHLHLRTTDPAAAVDFYRRQFPSTSATTAGGFAALQAGTGLLLFTKTDVPPSATPQSAYWHFGWHVRDAGKEWRRFQDTGVRLLPLYTDEGEQVTFSGQWWSGTLTRPEAVARRTRGQLAGSSVGWGYLEGPDGVKVEFQGDMPVEQFNHVHMYQESVLCAERWYRRHLNASPLGAARGAAQRADPDDCHAPLGDPSWLSLDRAGTVRVPSGGVRFGTVTINWYQRQQAAPLASSRGQVIDHMGLAVPRLAPWEDKLRREGVAILEGPYAFGTGKALLIEGPSREAIELVELDVAMHDARSEPRADQR